MPEKIPPCNPPVVMLSVYIMKLLSKLRTIHFLTSCAPTLPKRPRRRTTLAPPARARTPRRAARSPSGTSSPFSSCFCSTSSTAFCRTRCCRAVRTAPARPHTANASRACAAHACMRAARIRPAHAPRECALYPRQHIGTTKAQACLSSDSHQLLPGFSPAPHQLTSGSFSGSRIGQ